GPGEAVFIDEEGRFHSQQCTPHASLNPCIFEYVYLARPDSLIDGASVYETRLNMGEKPAEKIRRHYPHLEIAVVIPIPDSSRPSGLQLATAAPPVRFPNVYGIDMPTRAELIAAHRSEEEVGREIGADALIYQDLDQLKDAVRRANPRLANFETSCFDGVFVTGDVTSDY